MMFAVHVWDRKQRKLVQVRSGLHPLICDGDVIAEGAVRQLAAAGHIAVATADDESMAMKASPSAFWKWRRL